MKDPVFIDAQYMHSKNPKTFEVPTQKELNNIHADDIVKVCVMGERFWVKIKWIKGDKIIGIIDNELINEWEHGLNIGDVITFYKYNIYSIW